MDNLERISFIVPFDGKGATDEPELNFECSKFPSKLAINFRVGVVGLKPSTKYHLGLMIIPAHLGIKKGEQIQWPDGEFESISVYIDTQEGNVETGVNGQIIVTFSEARLPAKGLYSVIGILQTGDEQKTELHKNQSFFTAEEL
ncbi:hypothetical protein [Phytobacter sp. V91]|uniref:hypothetical protein n=1 Tax=Phytobacter sp. V91 TaxID=3369425 RepID=UPI003F62B476